MGMFTRFKLKTADLAAEQNFVPPSGTEGLSITVSPIDAENVLIPSNALPAPAGTVAVEYIPIGSRLRQPLLDAAGNPVVLTVSSAETVRVDGFPPIAQAWLVPTGLAEMVEVEYFVGYLG